MHADAGLDGYTFPRAAASRPPWSAGCTVPSTSLSRFYRGVAVHHGRRVGLLRIKRGTPAFCSTKSHKLFSHPRFATAHQNADPAAYFSQQVEPGAPYLRGTSHVHRSRCQGPLSAPEPRTSLLEAEERSQQGPGRKCVQLSGRPSPSFFRASSFGKSLRHLPKARRPANRDERDVAVPPFPRQQAKRLATSTLP